MNTVAPNDADSDSAVISIALMGRITERKARNSTQNMASITVVTIHGARARRLTAKSYSAAAWPNTNARPPGGGGTWRAARTSACPAVESGGSGEITRRI